MSKDKEQKTGILGDEVFELANEIASFVAQKLDEKGSLGVKAHMYAINFALQPILAAFGKYTIKLNGDDPIPEYLELIKNTYIKMTLKNQAVKWTYCEDKIEQYENMIAKDKGNILN